MSNIPSAIPAWLGTPAPTQIEPIRPLHSGTDVNAFEEKLVPDINNPGQSLEPCYINRG